MSGQAVAPRSSLNPSPSPPTLASPNEKYLRRKKSSLVKLMHRNRRWLLQEAYALWRDDARDATTLAKIEHMVVRNAQRKSLQT